MRKRCQQTQSTMHAEVIKVWFQFKVGTEELQETNIIQSYGVVDYKQDVLFRIGEVTETSSDLIDKFMDASRTLLVIQEDANLEATI